MFQIVRRVCAGSVAIALAVLAGAAAPPANPALPPGMPPKAAAAAAAAAAKANIDLSDGWIRATNADAKNAQLFLRVANVGKQADTLVGVKVAMSDGAEIRKAGQKGQAQAVSSLVVPAGDTVTFKPGGDYLLLTGLKAPLNKGDSFLVTLNFEKAGGETTIVKILAPDAKGPPAPALGGSPNDLTSGVSDDNN